MKGKSAFAQILESKMGGAPRPAIASATASPSDLKNGLTEDWLLKIFFTHGPLKAQVFSAYKGASQPIDNSRSANRQSTAESAFENDAQMCQPSHSFKTEGVGLRPKVHSAAKPATQSAPVEKPRVKRKLSFDQEKALKVFAKLGAKEINEFSTDLEIKQAYRRLAKKFHPDAGALSDQSFKEIAQAYQIVIG